ncbi:hypothetical protein JCM9743_36630 [Natrinema sp. JCM 9743]
MSHSVGTYKKPSSQLPEFVGFVSEADCDGVLKVLVESIDIAGRVGRKATHLFDSPPTGRIDVL